MSNKIFISFRQSAFSIIAIWILDKLHSIFPPFLSAFCNNYYDDKLLLLYTYNKQTIYDEYMKMYFDNVNFK